MASKRRREFLVLLACVALLAGAYAAAGFLLVPHLVKSQLRAFVTQNYGRSVSIGDVRFNPFTMELEAKDFSLPDIDNQPALTFHRLFVKLDLASIWRRGASFRAIELEQPYSRVLIRRDGALNLTELAKPFAEPSDDSPTRLFIDRLTVRDTAVDFEDRTHATPFRASLRPVSFELLNFSTTEATDNRYVLRGTSTAGERFGWNGAFTMEPLASRGRFEIADLQARTLWSYMRDSLGFEVSSGKINIAGDYTFSTATPSVALAINLRNVDVSQVGLKPRNGEGNYIDVDRLQIESSNFDLTRQSMQLGKVTLAGATVRAWRDVDGQINLLKLAGGAPPARVPDGSSAPPAQGPDETPAPPRAAPAAQARAVPATRASAAPPKPASAVPDARTSDPPSRWRLDAPDIAIEGLKVEAEDRQIKPAFAVTLNPIDVQLKGFTTAPNAELTVDASVRVDDSGQLKAHATLLPDSGKLTAKLDASQLDLATLQPYIGSVTQMTLLSGLLNAKLQVDRTDNGDLGINGEAEVAKLRTVDNALRQDFIKWDLVRASGIEFRSQPASIKIATIAMRAPYARVIIAADQTVNLSRVLSAPPGAPPPGAITSVRASPASTAPAAATPASAKSGKASQSPRGGSSQDNGDPMKISIGNVRIANGSANFADFWIQPNYAVSIQGLDGTIVGLSSSVDSRAKVALEGKVDRYAPASISGELNLLSASLFTDIKVSFKGVDMTSVTPYAGRFAGYKIEKGKLTVDVAYRVENRKLNADQRFVVDQLQLGERVESKDAVRLPLRLAVALLKDRNGVIDIGLPVSGSLDDPKFRIGPIIWKAIVGLLTRIATAPFALLGSMFGGGEEMNQVDFAPGEATLDPAGQEKMASLLKAMQERPSLQLDVPMTYSPDLDRPVLAERKLNDKLTQLAQEQSAKRKRKSNPPGETDLGDPATRFDLLVAQYRRDFAEDAALPPAAEAVETARKKKKDDGADFGSANAEIEQAIAAQAAVSDDELRELGKQRAGAIQEALLAQGAVEATRVFVIAAAAAPPAKDKVRVELSLK
jgi:hypothetical protein